MQNLIIDNIEQKINGAVEIGGVKIDVVSPMYLPDLMDIAGAYQKCIHGTDYTGRNIYSKEGFVLDNKFERIGSGTYGTVYGYKNYAIKFIENERDKQNKDIEVLKEISYLHCIPTLYAVIDNKIIIVERIEGQTVTQYIANYENPYNIDERIIDELDEALKTVVKAGYNPRDLHKKNVMITPDAEIKLVDVGWFVELEEYEKEYLTEGRYRRIEGFYTCQDWTGDSLKYWLERLEEKYPKLQEEAKNILSKYELSKLVNMGAFQGKGVRLDVKCDLGSVNLIWDGEAWSEGLGN